MNEELNNKYLAKMIEIEDKLKKQPWYDCENSHMEADDMLCELLSELGYLDLVKKFRELNKWYA